MSPFHNPYHFVPVSRKSKRDGEISRDSFENGDPKNVRHDRYLPGTYSGRLVCRLETETPICVAATREKPEGQAALAHPFELEGKPAIPASSLRGLFSSIAESVSYSALRVLERRTFSFRKTMKESLSAIGMVIREQDAYSLVPLCLPNFRVDPDGRAVPVDGADWKRLFPKVANLKTYVGTHTNIQDDHWKTSTYDGRGWRGLVYVKLTHDRDGHGFERTLTPDNRLYIDDGCHVRNGLVLGQRAVPTAALPVERIDVEQQGTYVKGISRVLGVRGARQNSIPLYRPAGKLGKERHGKKHELFIPLIVQSKIPISQHAVEKFHRMCDERTREVSRGGEGRVDEWELLPYHPAGTLRNTGDTPDWDVHQQCFRLKTGDLVYFQPDSECKTVDEVSLSAIWRNEAPGDSHGYFANVDPELTPFNPERKHITMAEAVFGFAEDVTDATESRAALTLASRVQFSHALYTGSRENNTLRELTNPYITQQGEWQTLRILGQPKPPSPALYFTHHNPAAAAQHIPKSLLDYHSHRPQGRKMYLHHLSKQVQAQAWTTQNDRADLNMKTRVRPVRKGTVYHFHVDFDNLSPEELGMILYALRPTGSFRHKIGMGKSIGLGGIRVDIGGLFLIDRTKRYSFAGFVNDRRYSECWSAAELIEGAATVRYSRELRDSAGSSALNLQAFRDTFRPDPTAARALELLGDPLAVHHPVHTPLVGNQDPERETFQWFVRNENASRQQLAPIQRGSGLPTLQD